MGDWVNLKDVIGDGVIIHTIGFGRGCPDTISCEIGGECTANTTDGFGARLDYECLQPVGCIWHNPLSVDPSGRQAWLSGAMGNGTFSLSAYLTLGRYGFTQLTVEWGMDFPDQSGYENFNRTEFYIRSNAIDAYLNADDAANYPPPAPTATPWPASTPVPQPTRVVVPFQTLQPANGVCLTKGAQFEWQDNVGLPVGHLYEIVVWRAGEDPMSSSRGITKADTRTSRWVDLDYLDDQRDWFAPGDYNWGILEINTEPYQRHKMLGIGGWFHYVHGTSCGS